MVFVKVRETYDLHTTKEKMTLIGIHTPKPDIIKKSYPGLLMQCRAYRPVSCDVRVACASVLPLDPKGVGLAEGDVAPEDVFNPILYKAISNKGMSQLEARINALGGLSDVVGNSADVDVDTATYQDEFKVYYGLLADTHGWKHANPMSGLSMNKLKPIVYEMVYNIGDTKGSARSVSQLATEAGYPMPDGNVNEVTTFGILGNPKPFPFLNCTSYSRDETSKAFTGTVPNGFGDPSNCEVNVPYLNVYCGAIIVPPSRLHEMFYRMVVEWTIEFSKLRPIGEVTDWYGLTVVADSTHYQNYSYESAKKAVTGTDDTILEDDACMVSANVDVNKVM